MGIDFIWLVLLVIGILFIGEKTGFRLINFTATLLLMYMAFEVEEVFLMVILILFGLLIVVYSVLGND